MEAPARIPGESGDDYLVRHRAAQQAEWKRKAALAQLRRRIQESDIPMIRRERDRCPICGSDDIAANRSDKVDGKTARSMKCAKCESTFMLLIE